MKLNCFCFLSTILITTLVSLIKYYFLLSRERKMLNSLNAGDFTNLKVHRTKSMIHSVETCKKKSFLVYKKTIKICILETLYGCHKPCNNSCATFFSLIRRELEWHGSRNSYSFLFLTFKLDFTFAWKPRVKFIIARYWYFILKTYVMFVSF